MEFMDCAYGLAFCIELCTGLGIGILLGDRSYALGFVIAFRVLYEGASC